MKHFINLTSRVINKLHITEIRKKPSKFYIYMNNNCIDGFLQNNIIIEICKKNDKLDYDTITNLIKKIK